MISVQAETRSIWRPLRELPQRRELIVAFARRELAARYRGSVLGLTWAILAPVVMIAIYTFIFAGIFGARFGNAAQSSTWDYALYVFCGLLAWNAFQESLQTSATTIVARTNLVKRVVFPLETLPVAHALAALANQLFGTFALVVAIVIVRRQLHSTLLWLPVLFALQLTLTIGLSWLVAAVGVFIRDTAQTLSLLLTAWMFLTPIIYPLDAVPEPYRAMIRFNPFTPLVQSYRRVMLEGQPPAWSSLLYFAACGLLLFLFGYWWFAKTRRNFADVI